MYPRTSFCLRWARHPATASRTLRPRVDTSRDICMTAAVGGVSRSCRGPRADRRLSAAVHREAVVEMAAVTASLPPPRDAAAAAAAGVIAVLGPPRVSCGGKRQVHSKSARWWCWVGGGGRKRYGKGGLGGE